MNLDNEFSEKIGKRIFERRKQLGMTQEELSEIIDTTPQAISNYERGERELKAKALLEIAQALNVTTDYLLLGKWDSLSSNIENKLLQLPENDVQLINDIVENCIRLAKK